MKKVLPLLLVLALCFACFACGKKDSGSSDGKKDSASATEAVTNNPDLEAVLKTDTFKSALETMQDEEGEMRFEIEGNTVIMTMQLKVDPTEEELEEFKEEIKDQDSLAELRSMVGLLGFDDAGVEDVKYLFRVLDKNGDLIGEVELPDGDKTAEETEADDETEAGEPTASSLEALINSDEMQASFAAGVGEADEYDVSMRAEGNTVILKMKIKVEITEEQKAQLVQNVEGEDLWSTFSLDSLAEPAADLGFTDIQFKFVLEDKDGSVLYDEYITH